MFWKVLAFVVTHPIISFDTLLSYGWRQGWERIKLVSDGPEKPFKAIPALYEKAPASTPLHRAWLQQTQELIRAKADVNARNREGRTPLHFVPNTDIAAALIEAYADVNARDSFGNTPLHCVCVKDDDVAILLEILEEKGAHLNARNSEGETPLFVAICNEKFETARHLIRLGAHLEIPNNQNETPIVAAFKRGFFQMFKLLKESGANIPEAISEHEMPARDERKMEYKESPREGHRRPKRTMGVKA